MRQDDKIKGGFALCLVAIVKSYIQKPSQPRKAVPQKPSREPKGKLKKPTKPKSPHTKKPQAPKKQPIV